MIEFEVFGRPAPQGSKTIMRGRLVETSKYLPAWRKALAEAATQAHAETGFYSSQPLSVSVIFTLAKPKTVKREEPTVPPDLDKLARSLDSLTGILYDDDAQIVKMHLRKQYGEPQGAVIKIEEL